MKAGNLGKVRIMFDRFHKQLVCLLDVAETPFQLDRLHKHLYTIIINTVNTYMCVHMVSGKRPKCFL